ncbi:MAG: hemerythrin domain-containing protein [Prolixibacteraceae bacterium]|nr:hemerythrin domain-containing protein [Prolixibacteraceae bacterium]
MNYTDDFRIEGNFRMADVINANERLLLIIERFGISLGFGDKTIFEICTDYGLDPSLVLVVMNVFNSHSFPAQSFLSVDMLPGLISYLKNGHRYYLKEKIPFIGELIDRFIENTDNPDAKLIKSFFREYAREVSEHMYLEDSTVFPYILTLYNYSENAGAGIPDYSIDEFVEHHSDIEEKLDDLMHLLIKHFPPTQDRFYRNLILLELFNLQYDLNDHSGIENRILAPLVRQLEQKAGKQ